MDTNNTADTDDKSPSNSDTVPPPSCHTGAEPENCDNGSASHSERHRDGDDVRHVLFISHTTWSVVIPTLLRTKYPYFAYSAAKLPRPNRTRYVGVVALPAPDCESLPCEESIMGMLVSIGEALFPLVCVMAAMLKKVYFQSPLIVGKVCANLNAVCLARHIFVPGLYQFNLDTIAPSMLAYSVTNYLKSYDEPYRTKCFSFFTWLVSASSLHDSIPAPPVQSAFNLACQLGDKEIITWFIMTLPNHISSSCAPAFQVLCENGRQDLAELVHSNLRISSTSISTSVLEATCLKHHCDIVKWLIEKFELSTWDVRWKDNLVFKTFAEEGNIELAQWLTKKFSLDSNDAAAGNNYAFYESCQRGHVEFARWLYETFKLPRLPMIVPTLFRSACGNGWLDMAKFLHSIEKQTVNQIRNPLVGSPIFSVVCEEGFLPIAKWLKKTFSLNTSDVRVDHYHPLTSAVVNNHTDLASWIIHAFHLSFDELWSVLMAWCSEGYLNGVKWLFETFPTISPPTRLRAIEIARTNKHFAIVEFLESYP
ncbi:hypothetical protein Pelo_5537 [Pelomyxa schiedti]|nr:hypothetical protein Pelo_5537 [Pelomyxa schiedti]